MMDISKVIASIPELSGVQYFELLNIGAVNKTWRLFTEAGSFVLRQDTSMVKTLGLDRHSEIDVLETAAKSGLGPAVIWADPNSGLLLTEYIEGVAWSKTDLYAHQNLVRIAKRLDYLHRIPSDLQTLKAVCFSSYALRYAQQLATSEAEKLADEVIFLDKEWCSDPSRHVLCHNDLVYGNIINVQPGGELMFIDWEYAGLGEPYFDLAVFIQHHPLSATDTKVFLEAYGVLLGEGRLEGCLAIYDRLLALWLMLICTDPNARQDYQVALDAVVFRLNH
ncbi:MAG: phosphotransferase [Gammaproteobacteria bacterium]|nr:phosphotransferase [Gammaproteobacteria bacterium]MCP4090122.1 phosphotransferase [Gammaproteobacteria bacterium]MCP4831760.1 phosphotransferase [Gammaproteobacteria bacterium]MCP4929485.1 phosphotransferase [Gammaproteobacteria bacterium]